MTNIVGGILGDCLSVVGVPTSTASSAIDKLMKKRHNLLQEIVLSEFRQGNFHRADEDELISIFFRLIRDAEEGVAKNNLCLMARVINGMAEKNAVKASSFLKYANTLSGLSEDEVTVLGIMIKGAVKPINTHYGMKDGVLVNTVDPGENELKERFPEYLSIQQSLVRTGLVTFSVSSENMMGQAKERTRVLEGVNSKIVYSLTSLMNEILEYTKDFDFNKVV